MTSTIASTALNPTPAIPVVYTERTAMQDIDPKQLAKELLEPEQYKCFTQLVGKESAWRSVNNPTSSAAGVGQLLAGTYRKQGLTNYRCISVYWTKIRIRWPMRSVATLETPKAKDRLRLVLRGNDEYRRKHRHRRL